MMPATVTKYVLGSPLQSTRNACKTPTLHACELNRKIVQF